MNGSGCILIEQIDYYIVINLSEVQKKTILLMFFEIVNSEYENYIMYVEISTIQFSFLKKKIPTYPTYHERKKYIFM